MSKRNLRIIVCWRCGQSRLVDMADVKRDSRGRPLYTCPICTLAIEKLDRKGLR